MAESRLDGVSLKEFRRILGQYPTGVVIITATSADGSPIGMTVGSFGSASLEPPLVSFMPSINSTSWKMLQESGNRLCINVLSAAQEPECRAIAVRKTDKFAGLRWHFGETGLPVLDKSLITLDCTIEAVYPAGDHKFVLARVDAIEARYDELPLLFFKGGYGSFTPHSMAAAAEDLVTTLGLIDHCRPAMGRLAAKFDTEVSASIMRADELVVVASAGQVEDSAWPSWVGQRFPFIPPMGGVHAAWGDREVRDLWDREVKQSASGETQAYLLSLPSAIRERGYALALGHKVRGALIEQSSSAGGNPRWLSREQITDLTHKRLSELYPKDLSANSKIELRTVTVPVLDNQNSLAFALTIWGPRIDLSHEQAMEYIDGLRELAAVAANALEKRQLIGAKK